MIYCMISYNELYLEVLHDIISLYMISYAYDIMY